MAANKTPGRSASTPVAEHTARLQQAVELRGTTGTAVEAAAGLHRGEGARFLSGVRAKRGFSLDQADRLGRVLNVDPDWLLLRTDTMGTYSARAGAAAEVEWRYPAMRLAIDYNRARNPDRWSPATMAMAPELRFKFAGQPTIEDCEVMLDQAEGLVRNLEAFVASKDFGDKPPPFEWKRKR